MMLLLVAISLFFIFNFVIGTSYIDHVTTSSNGSFNFILNRGDRIDSTSLITRIRMQSDGNLVLYHPLGDAQWATNTTNRGEYVELDISGNLMVKNTSDNIIWQSDSGGHTATHPHRLIVVDEPCVYIMDHTNTTLWHKGNGCVTDDPTPSPTQPPSKVPTKYPSHHPTQLPSNEPSRNPFHEPSRNPTIPPTIFPSQFPSVSPTQDPITPQPTIVVIAQLPSTFPPTSAAIIPSLHTSAYQQSQESDPHTPTQTVFVSYPLLALFIIISVVSVIIIAAIVIHWSSLCKTKRKIVETKLVKVQSTSVVVANRENVKVDALTQWFENTLEVPPEYLDMFVANGFDTLTRVALISGKEELKKMGVTRMGHINQIWGEIEQLRQDANHSEDANANDGPKPQLAMVQAETRRAMIGDKIVAGVISTAKGQVRNEAVKAEHVESMDNVDSSSSECKDQDHDDRDEGSSSSNESMYDNEGNTITNIETAAGTEKAKDIEIQTQSDRN